MEESYTTEKKDGFVYVWHASGLDRVGIAADELRKEAAKLFPREFEEIKS